MYDIRIEASNSCMISGLRHPIQLEVRVSLCMSNVHLLPKRTICRTNVCYGSRYFKVSPKCLAIEIAKVSFKISGRGRSVCLIT